MDQKNLDLYGHEPIQWSRPLAELEKFVSGPGFKRLDRDDTSRWPAARGRGRRDLARRQFLRRERALARARAGTWPRTRML